MRSTDPRLPIAFFRDRARQCMACAQVDMRQSCMVRDFSSPFKRTGLIQCHSPHLSLSIMNDPIEEPIPLIIWVEFYLEKCSQVALAVALFLMEAYEGASSFLLGHMTEVLLAVIAIFGSTYYLCCIRDPWFELRQRAMELKVDKPNSYLRSCGREVWVVANPIGGDGNGVKIFNAILKPLLEKAGIPYRFIQTTHQGHPKQISMSVDPKLCACLALISGDGMVHEVMQGYACRAKHDAKKLRELYDTIPLAILPGGSSNGLSTSFGYVDVVAACDGLINGTQQPLDVNEIDFLNPQREGLKLWDAHAFCFGLFADYDRLVETKLRKLGTTLKGILGAIAIIGQRQEYTATFDFLDASHNDFENDEERKAKKYSDASLLPDSPGKPAGWKRIEGSMLLLTALNTTWAANDAHTAPYSDRSSGSVDILFIPGGSAVSRLGLLKTMMAFESGDHLEIPFVKIYRAKRWNLLPDIKHDHERTTLDCSGEQFPLSETTCTCHKGLAKIIGFPDKQLAR